jgi:hypothetical protein
MQWHYSVKKRTDDTYYGPWPLFRCILFIEEKEREGFAAGEFKIYRRPIGEWEECELE